MSFYQDKNRKKCILFADLLIKILNIIKIAENRLLSNMWFKSVHELKENLKKLSSKVKNQIFNNLQENNLPKLRYRVYNNVEYDYANRWSSKQCQCYWDSQKRIYKFDILNVTHQMIELLKSEEDYENFKKKLSFFIENHGVSRK